jgi:DNA-binding response OmpR family regulator
MPTMDRPCILVVDDEPMVVEVVERYLKRDGYSVITAGDGESALARVRESRPHLVVLDLMLPGLDGLEVCRRIRANSKTPIIMVTARGEETDRIAGLDIGADDYVAKPFSPRELVSRVRAVLRRSYDSGDLRAREPLTSGDLTIDPRSRVVIRNGSQIELTAREFDLLWFLATHPN